MPRLGLVQVYTGDGKGKTTAALGLALRAVGHGWRVAFCQFLKGGGGTGEALAAARLAPEFTLHQYGSGRLIIDRPPTAEEIGQASAGLAHAAELMQGGRAEMVVLDEVAAAVNLGLLKAEDVAACLRARAPGVEIVLTGRGMPPQLLAEADLVSEITARRHPYAKGVAARQGIEY